MQQNGVAKGGAPVGGGGGGLGPSSPGKYLDGLF